MSHAARWLAPVLVLVLCGCASRGAAPPPGPVAQVPVAVPAEEINAFIACRRLAKTKEILLDAASRRLHQTVCGATLWFDGLFGERDLASALRSYGHVELSTAWSEVSGGEASVRFIARVKLPALTEKLSVFVGVDDEDDFARDRSEGRALRSQRRPSDRDAFLLGLGYAGVTTDTFQSEFKVGVSEVRLPKVFVQNRLSYVPYSRVDKRVMLRLTPFWNNRDRKGATTSAAFDHTIGEAHLLRWGSTATITESTDGFDWRTALILYQNLRGARALAYQVFIRGVSEAPVPVGEYGLRAVYREPFFRERLFGQLVLGYGWPRDDPALERVGSADIGVGVEMLYGKAP